jgi:hypothetical protein
MLDTLDPVLGAMTLRDLMVYAADELGFSLDALDGMDKDDLLTLLLVRDDPEMTSDDDD